MDSARQKACEPVCAGSGVVTLCVACGGHAEDRPCEAVGR